MLSIPDRNTKALLDLADFMEGLDAKQYTQRNYIQHDLGNGQIARCICGWCNHRTGDIESDHNKAQATLGITPQMAMRLFAGHAGAKTDWMSVLYGQTTPTPKEAAQTLRHLAVTGDVPVGW